MKATITYKLTDGQGRTRNDTQWGVGVEHTASGEGELCGPGWIHVYSHPLLAVLLNPIHGNFQEPRLWRCEVSGKCKHDRGLKSGYTSVKTVEELPLPVVTDTQRVAFGILCAKAEASPEWNKWADDWLSGKDRSQKAATEWAEAATEWAAAVAEWAASTKPLDLEAIAERAVREF